MIQLNDISAKEIRAGFFGKLVHGDKGTLSIWEIKKDSAMQTHQHPHEQITYVLEGELEMQIGDEHFVLTAGNIHVIPSETPHNAFARTDVKVIDFFSPARDDYR